MASDKKRHKKLHRLNYNAHETFVTLDKRRELVIFGCRIALYNKSYY